MKSATGLSLNEYPSGSNMSNIPQVLYAEIVLDTLSYSKKTSAINRRLKLFCFKNMMLHLPNEQELCNVTKS